MENNCVIITSINKPTEAVLKYIKIPNLDVIIVADQKTPIKEYINLDCKLLTLEEQNSLYPLLSKLIPLNHYSRKNLGYLYAIDKGYKIILETDDDNIPYPEYPSFANNELNKVNQKFFELKGNGYINIYKKFTKLNIWPRGFPLRYVLTEDLTKDIRIQNIEEYFKNVSIIQGLADGDPDVDAIFRLTSKLSQNEIKFDKNNSFYKIGEDQYCPGNTQNTIWLKPEDFYLMYIPSCISFRICDILKMYIAQSFIMKNKNTMVFQGATVYQDRNLHDNFKDFEQEVDLYLKTEEVVIIINEIVKSKESLTDLKELLKKLYKKLIKINIINDYKELEILSEWLNCVDAAIKK